MRCVLICVALTAAACGPRARIPPRPLADLPGTLSDGDSLAGFARSLAPVLFLQRDEWFPLERVVAVLHPTRRVIAYHLLWRDDVHGSWIPFTVPTDQEIVWIGYDSTAAPTDVWTLWHGTVVHTAWRDRGPSTINVQWGKHGLLPRGIVESDLPRFKSLNSFYLFSWIGIPDMWLGKATRPGPGCFCYGYDRYREFTKPLILGDRVDLVARTAEPRELLAAVFGRPYSKKRAWPSDSGQPARTEVTQR
jgi:hypothetical protein